MAIENEEFRRLIETHQRMVFSLALRITGEYEAYSKKLTDGTWNCYIHVREKNGSTDICSRTAADHETNEMVILTAEPREITFIHMSGKMSLSDLGRVAQPMVPSRPSKRLRPIRH